MVLLVLVACGDAPPEIIEPPIVEPDVVESPPELAVELGCVELDETDRVLGTSPEGDLWVGGDAGEPIRVFQPRGQETAFDSMLAGELQAVVPWSDEVATVATGDEMWRVESEGPRYLFVPEGVRGVNFFCGDPERDGAAVVVTDDGIFERAAGQWYALGPEDGMRFSDIGWLASVDGACRLRRGGLWFGEGEQLWRIDGSSVGEYVAPGATGPAAIGEAFGVAVPAGDRVLFANERGPRDNEWSEVVFPAGDVNAIGAGGGVLWVSAGSHLYRYDGEWLEADPAPVGALDRVFPDALGGAWLRAGTSLCHVGVDTVQVRGLRPYQHFQFPQTSVSIVTDLGTTEEVQVRIDGGEAIDAVFVEDDTGLREVDEFAANNLRLGAPGWHSLDVSVGDSLVRSVPFRVVAGDLSWSADVLPVFDVHCADSECHGAGSTEAVDLSTFDAWVEYAFEIQTRVANGTMPRDAGEEWTPEEATLLIDWIEGGLQP